MPTQKQLHANRRNAKRSSGPRTEDGKVAASQNARTHGLSARDTVIAGENPKKYRAFLRDLTGEFQPATPSEFDLVQTLADAAWRLRRAMRLETALLGLRLQGARSRYALPAHQRVSSEDPLHQQLLGSSLIHDAHDSDTLSKLSRYEMRLTRRYFQALAHLNEVRERRLARAAASGGPENRNDKTNPISGSLTAAETICFQEDDSHEGP